MKKLATILVLLGVVLAVTLLTDPEDPGVAEVSATAEEAVEAAMPPDAHAGGDRASDDERSAAEAAPIEEDVAEVAAPTPEEIVYGEAFVLRVRDRASRVELGDVELRSLPDVYMSSSWARPDPRSTLLESHATSPITLRTWREASTKETSALGFLVASGGGAGGERRTFESPEHVERGFVFWARTPGRAWGRAEVDVTAGGERELLLGSEASVEVRLDNVKLATYEALKMRPYLWVRRPDKPWNLRTVDRVGLGAHHVFEGLEAGTIELSVELGTSYTHGEPIVLARVSVPLDPGARAQVSLRLDDPPAARPTARLSGTLSFPPFEGQDAVELRLYDVTKTHQAVKSIPLAEMSAASGAVHAWDAGELPVGRYQTKIWPFLRSEMIDLPREGNTSLVLSIPALCDAEIETVDATTGARVPLPTLFWSPEQRFEGMVNFVGQSLKAGENPGVFRIVTIPGLIEARNYDTPEGLAYGLTTEKFELQPGFQKLRLELAPLCAIVIELRDGDTALPRSVFQSMSVGANEEQGDGRVVMDSTRTARRLELSGPGTYIVTFIKIPADYQPIEPARVEVRAGQIAELIIPLERK